jgi:hypothetical protein
MLTTIWRKEWKLVAMLRLEGVDVINWERYTPFLSSSHIRIKEVEDKVIWGKNLARVIYTSKTSYQSLSVVEGVGYLV